FTDSIVNIKQYYIYCLDTLIKQNKNFIDSIYKLEWLTTANKVQIENMNQKHRLYLDSIQEYHNIVEDLRVKIPKKHFPLYSLAASLNLFYPSNEVETSASLGAIFHLNLYPILGFWKDLGLRMEYIDPKISKPGISEWDCYLVSLGVCHYLFDVFRIQETKFGIKTDLGVFWSGSKRTMDRNLDTYCSGLNFDIELNIQKDIKLFPIEIFASCSYYYSLNRDLLLNIDYNSNINFGRSILKGALGLRFNVWSGE
ncbi:MAG: hypothetical protein V1779_00710, partial [bacterium]